MKTKRRTGEYESLQAHYLTTTTHETLLSHILYWNKTLRTNYEMNSHNFSFFFFSYVVRRTAFYTGHDNISQSEFLLGKERRKLIGGTLLFLEIAVFPYSVSPFIELFNSPCRPKFQFCKCIQMKRKPHKSIINSSANEPRWRDTKEISDDDGESKWWAV